MLIRIFFPQNHFATSRFASIQKKKIENFDIKGGDS